MCPELAITPKLGVSHLECTLRAYPYWQPPQLFRYPLQSLTTQGPDAMSFYLASPLCILPSFSVSLVRVSLQRIDHVFYITYASFAFPALLLPILFGPDHRHRLDALPRPSNPPGHRTRTEHLNNPWNTPLPTPRKLEPRRQRSSPLWRTSIKLFSCGSS
jgi:hypothetical protein